MPTEQRTRGAPHRELPGRDLAWVLVLLSCANFLLHVSANTTAAQTSTTQPPNTDRSPKPPTSSSGSDSRDTTTPEPKGSPSGSPGPANLVTTVGTTSANPTTGSRTTRLPATQSIETHVPALSQTTSDFATTPELAATSKFATTSKFVATSGPPEAPTTPRNTTTASSGSRTVTPVDYVIPNVTRSPAPAPATTRGDTARPGHPTESRPGAGSPSGPVGTMTTAPPTVTSAEFQTSAVAVVETVVVEITDVIETVEYVTPNGNTTGGGAPGLDPDREKDELRKLLSIIGGSIGGALLAILVIFVIVYRVAKRRRQKTGGRYYNFKKKKTNYEKVLHLQKYYGDVDTDNPPAGTGAAWVFQDNAGEAGKMITLEIDPKDRDKPSARSGRRIKSRNQNKNNHNRNKGGVVRGNYQVLAELFPAPRNVPPGVVEGAVPSNSDDEGGAILDTSFAGASLGAPQPEERSSDVDSAAAASDRLSCRTDSSFNGGGGGPTWPAWSNRPFVTIKPGDDTTVEL